MKTKAKKFSYKLLALFMALVMGITCFSGVLTSYAATSYNTKYVDGDVEYNDIAWNILSDEQLATAILDFADENLPALAELEKSLAASVDGMKVSVITINWDINKRQISVKALGSTWVTITVKLGSVDELAETLESVDDALHSGIVKLVNNVGVDLGIITSLDFSATDGLRRGSNTSCEIVRGVLGLIYDNIDPVVDDLLRGTLSLGVLNDTLNVYKLVGGLFDAPDGYQSDSNGFVYNIVRSILFKYTNWFDGVQANGKTEKQNYLDNPSTFIYDEVLLEKMTTELLTKINAEITYKGTGVSDTVSSRVRYAEIKAKAANDGISFRQAAADLGYDPDLVYTDNGNVYLFVYGTNADGSVADDAQKISITTSDSLAKFGYEALDLAWKTALKDTVNTVRVNNNVDRGHGTNFDNAFYYWAKANIPGGWKTNTIDANGNLVDNISQMYTMANLVSWAESDVTVVVEAVEDEEEGTTTYVDGNGIVFDESIIETRYDDDNNEYLVALTDVAGSYGAESTDEFIGWVENNYTFDRSIADDATGSWRDIDEETLFNKLRYSPIADYIFDLQTGPINLYFMQTGVPYLENFFESYRSYSSIMSGVNNALVAAVKDVFISRDNIYKDVKGDMDVPAMTEINPTTIDASATRLIAETIINNAIKIVQYTADTTDKNILNGFYTNGGTTLDETNLEDAMIPLLVACIGQINITGTKLQDLIHPEDWDRCKDSEAVAFVCLREYLSFSLPQKDYNVLATITDDRITADFETCIKPMGRDALIYVIEPYVPVTDKNGNRWTADTDTIDTTTDILDLLNSVLCYYADLYTNWDVAARSGEKGMGVAVLLGICNQDGTSKVTKTNTIWQNLDNIINRLLPIIGTLQGNGHTYGNASSYDLIMRDIINGFFDIGTKVDGDMYGMTNFLNDLLSFVSAAPIQTDSLVITVYNVLKDAINGLFGPRYAQQQWVPIPDATSSHPFDDLFKKAVLAGTDSNNVGAVHKLLNNFIEFSGFGYNGINTYPDTILPGLTFAVSAVNSFFNFLPFIGDHQLKLASAEYDPSTITGAKASNSCNVVVTNNATGINTAWIDGMNDNEVVQNNRYYIQVTAVQQTRSDGTTTTVTGFSSERIAPGKSISIPVTTNFLNTSNNSCTYIVTVTYNVYDGLDATSAKYSGVQTSGYQYLSSEISWYDTVYPSSREENGIRRFPSSLEPGASNSAGVAPNTTQSTPTFGTDGKLFATYPKNIVVSSTSLSTINSMGLRVRNTTGSTGSSAGMDGVYFYDTSSVYTNRTTGTAVTENDDENLTSVTLTKANAIPVFDPETGDLLRYGLYDVAYDGGSFDRGGYDDNALSDMMKEAQAQGRTLTSRTHVAYTLQEAINNGIIAAYYVNNNNTFDYIYLKTGNITYETILANVSMRGPVVGTYINAEKITVEKDSTTYISPIKYLTGSNIEPGTYPCNINFYTANNNNGTGTFDFIVADDGNASALNNKYEEISSLLANYRQSDFTDCVNGKSPVFAKAQNALLQALSVESTVLNATTAPQLADNTILTETTFVTTSPYGDKAYVPYSTSNDSTLPESIKNDAYVGQSIKNNVQLGGIRGIYYFDAACTMPIYSNVELTSSGVKGGKDAAGIPVTAVTKDGTTTYYLTNTKLMETQWDELTYDAAWLAPTNVQATNDDGKLLYEQVEYVYRNSLGNKVNSGDDWACKLPATEDKLVPNDGDEENRGLYTQALDNLEYVTELLYDKLDTSLASSFITDVSETREGLIENNFDIITYNKMVSAAKDIEALYKVVVDYISNDIVTDDDGNPVLDQEGNVVTAPKAHSVTVSYEDYKGYRDNPNLTITSTSVYSTLSSLQIEEYLDLFEFAMLNVIERGYIGDQLEAEIVCAANGEYDQFDVTPATYDEDGKVVTDAIVRSSAVASPDYGAYVGGVLTNAGAEVYPAALWSNYINALAAAVELAQFGNTDYAFADRDYYSSEDKDLYTAQVVDAYNADTALQIAENALENTKNITLVPAQGGVVKFDGVVYNATTVFAIPENTYATFVAVPDAGNACQGFMVNDELVRVQLDENGEYPLSIKADTTITLTPVFGAAGITVSGKVTIANTITGGDSGFGLRGVNIVAGGSIVNGKVVGGEVVGTTGADGTFEVPVTTGVTSIIAVKENVIFAREATISGASSVSDVNIAVVMGDYNNDQLVNATDKSLFYAHFGNSNDFDYDFNSDGLVNATDKSLFFAFFGKTINYTSLSY